MSARPPTRRRGDRPAVFGEVLFDRFEDGSEVLGGAPFNVAWNLRGLGLNPLFLSRVGQDELGDRILESMRAFDLDTSGIQLDPDHPTGTVEVRVAAGEPRFDIVQRRAYDFITPMEPTSPEVGLGAEFSLVYHGSLALRGETSANSAARLVERARAGGNEIPIFFDVNLRSPWWEPDGIEHWMKTADHIKLNEDELEALVPTAGTLEDRAGELLKRSGTMTVNITRGAEGAVAFTSEGARAETRPNGNVPVVDTVGAGDAFSSVLIVGILGEWPLELTLDRAREFAEGVVGLRGATTPNAEFYARFRSAWSLA